MIILYEEGFLFRGSSLCTQLKLLIYILPRRHGTLVSTTTSKDP